MHIVQSQHHYRQFKSRKVQKHIEKAKDGDTEACKSLAICYRDGDGVEKSWINMVCYHINTLTLCCIYMNISAIKECLNRTKRISRV